MENKDRARLAITFIATAAIFAFRESIIWALGKLLDKLPFKKLPDGTTDLSAVPWFQIGAVVLIVAAVGLLLANRYAPNVKAPSAEDTTPPPLSAEQAAELIEWHKKFQADFDGYRQEFAAREEVVQANIDGARSQLSFDTQIIKGQMEAMLEKFDAMQRDFPMSIIQLMNMHVSPILDRSIDFNEEAKASLARIEAIAAGDPPQSPQDTEPETPQ